MASRIVATLDVDIACKYRARSGHGAD
jgi:hypothetical protein